jgi:hypothetical protein
MSQISRDELARRVGVPGSALSACEHSHRQAAGVDLERAAVILAQVLDLAELLPQRRRGALAYPVLSRLVA